MRPVLRWLAVVVLAIACATPLLTPSVPPLVLHGQEGALGSLPADLSEDEWIDLAQRMADRRGEAIAVTQCGRLVVLVNPRPR
jgi:hypothetical protein